VIKDGKLKRIGHGFHNVIAIKKLPAHKWEWMIVMCYGMDAPKKENVPVQELTLLLQ